MVRNVFEAAFAIGNGCKDVNLASAVAIPYPFMVGDLTCGAVKFKIRLESGSTAKNLDVLLTVHVKEACRGFFSPHYDLLMSVENVSTRDLGDSQRTSYIVELASFTNGSEIASNYFC